MLKDRENQFKYVTGEKLARLTQINNALGFEPAVHEVKELENEYMLKVSYETDYSTAFHYRYVVSDFEVKLPNGKVDEKVTKMVRKDLLNDKERGEEYSADLREFLVGKVDAYIEELKNPTNKEAE